MKDMTRKQLAPLQNQADYLGPRPTDAHTKANQSSKKLWIMPRTVQRMKENES